MNVPNKAIPFLWYFSKGYRLKLFFLILFLLAEYIITAYFSPYILQLVIDKYNNNSLIFSNIIYYTLIYTLLTSIIPVFLIFQNKILIRSKELMVQNILKTNFNHILQQDLNYFNNNFSGDLSNKLINLISGFDNIFDRIVKGANLFLCFSIVFILTLRINYIMTIFIMLWLVVYTYLLLKIGKKYAEKTKIYKQEESKTLGIVNDCLVNIGSIKSFTKEKEEFKIIQEQSNRILLETKKSFSTERKVFLFNYVSLQTLIFGIFIFAFYFYKINVITLGKCIFLIQMSLVLISFIKRHIESVSNLIPDIAKYQVSLDLILIKPKIIDKIDNKQLICNNGKIVFKDLNFRYKNK